MSQARELVAAVRDATVSFAPRHRWLAPVEDRVVALRCVSLEIRAGEIVALVGESGSGKSTLGKLVVGLVRTDSGSVDVVRNAQARRAAGIVFQDSQASLNPRSTLRAAIGEVLQVHERLGRDAARERVDELLAKVGLTREVADLRPHELSGGQRQRAAIARSLAARPSLLVCDEVVSALDASIGAQVLELLCDLREREGLALLFITHDVAAARRIADRVAVMYAAEIVEEGPVRAVLERPAHPYTRALLAARARLDPSAPRPRALDGEPPSPTRAPSGCRFHPRCPLADARCSVQAPARVSVSEGHVAACWFALDQGIATS